MRLAETRVGTWWRTPGVRRLRRILLVYAGLVGVPAVAVLLLLISPLFPDGEARATQASPPPAEMTVVARPFIAVLIILASCAVAGALARRLRQPAVVGQILAGLLLGPSVLGAVWPAAFQRITDPRVEPILVLLAQLGVILFVFMAGYEVNARKLRRQGQLAVVISHVSITLPFLLGVIVAVPLFTRFASGGMELVPFTLFLGASMSVTALPVMARILQERGMLDSSIGSVALSCAVADDVTAWCLLAAVAALARAASLSALPLMVAGTLLFALGAFAVLRPALARFVGSRWGKQPSVVMVVLVVGLFSCAACTDAIGVHPMFGAFVFGLVCPRGAPAVQWAHQWLRAPTMALLIPVFFAYTGLHTQLNLLVGAAQPWVWCLLVLVLAVAGKLFGSTVAARWLGLSWHDSVQLGALMNCRGLTELVFLNVGLELGVIGPTLFTMLVVMALATTVMTGPLLDVTRWLRHAQRDAAESTTNAKTTAGEIPTVHLTGLELQPALSDRATTRE